MPEIKVFVTLDKKLSVQYNSIGLSIGTEVPVELDPANPNKVIEVIEMTKKALEPVLDKMLMDSAATLPRLAKKAGDVYKQDIPY